MNGHTPAESRHPHPDTSGATTQVAPSLSPLLHLKHVSKSFGETPVLRDITFRLYPGETLCLLGPSGSGKSTLLRLIAGLEEPDEGEILWAGEDLTAVPVHKRGFGLMFQDYALFPHLTVWDNVAFGLRMQGLPREEIEPRVADALRRVNLEHLAQRRVTELSGGEQQRVALARTLAPRPRLLMLDEPLGSLDRTLRERLLEDLRRILREAETPAIYVTHDQEEAFALADRVLILREGRIVQGGTPESVYARPANAWVAQFLGLRNILPGRVLSVQPLRVETEEGVFTPSCEEPTVRPGERLLVLLRPTAVREDIPASGEENVLSGRVVDVVFLGDVYRVDVRTPRGRLFRFRVEVPPPVGAHIRWSVAPEQVGCVRDEKEPGAEPPG